MTMRALLHALNHVFHAGCCSIQRNFVTYGVIRFVQYTMLPVLSDLLHCGAFQRSSANQELKEFDSLSYVFFTDKEDRAICFTVSVGVVNTRTV